MSWSDIWSGITETAGDIGKFGKDLLGFGSGDYFGNLKSDFGNIFSLQGTPSVPSTFPVSEEPALTSLYGGGPTGGGVGGTYATRAGQPSDWGITPTAPPTKAPTEDKTFVQKAMDSLAANPIPALMLGMAGVNALRGPQTSTAEKTIANALKQQTQIPSQIAQEQMKQYQSGALTTFDQQQLDNWYKTQKAAIDDYWGRAGAPNSSGHVEMLNKLQQDMIAKADQLRTQYMTNALSASGTSGTIGSNLTNALAQIQASGDQASAQNLMGLLQAYGMSMAKPYVPAATTTP